MHLPVTLLRQVTYTQTSSQVQSSICFILTYFCSCCKATPESHSSTDQQTTSILQFKNQPVILIDLFLCFPSISLLCWLTPTHIFFLCCPCFCFAKLSQPWVICGRVSSPCAPAAVPSWPCQTSAVQKDHPDPLIVLLSSSILTHNPSLQSFLHVKNFPSAGTS